ncbi:DUF692 family multinuclear iron-containing protein [Sorangium sp. So ce1128]
MLVLENITYDFDVPRWELSQAEFLGRVVARTGCGVLLDATNLYTNATKHGFDFADFLDRMPLDRIVQVHVAGGYRDGGVLLDSHSHAVEDGSWDVLRALVQRADVKGVIIKRDANFPAIGALLREVDQARSILNSAARRPTAG